MTYASHILVIIEAPIATTQLIEQILSACAIHHINYSTRLLADLTPEDFGANTLPVVVRSCDPLLAQWIDMLRSANHPYIYYIDDNFWELKGDSLLAAYYQHPLIRNTLNLVVRYADVVITNSEPLSNVIRPINPKVQILPASFDFDLIANVEPDVTDEIRIGFAGSTSRQSDLSFIASIIPTILRNNPQIVFEFAGTLPQGIKPSDRIRFFPYQDSYDAFIRFKAKRHWRIGLAPLHDSSSNKCKTDNKFREYGACGIAGLYSSVQPYTDTVTDGVTGLLVENNIHAWEHAVLRLVNDPALCKKLGQSARLEVEKKYSTHNVAAIWAVFFKDAADDLRKRKSRRKVQHPRKRAALLGYLRRMRIIVATVYHQGGASLVLRKAGMRLLAIRFKHPQDLD